MKRGLLCGLALMGMLSSTSAAWAGEEPKAALVVG
jgi:hypothetical protein